MSDPWMSNPSAAVTTQADVAARADIPWRRLHPAYLLISLGRTLRAVLPFIVVGIWNAPRWFIALVLALSALRSIATWWRKTYSVSEGALRVRSGVFNRTEHTISLHRITSLEQERGVIQRIFGVWALRVHTPGNDHRSTVRLKCLSPIALESLRDALRPLTATALPTGSIDPIPTAAVAGEAESFVVAALDTRTLLVAACTGTSVPLILVGAASTFGRARDVLPERLFQRLSHHVFLGGMATVLLLLAGVILAVLAGVALTSLRLAHFTLIREGDRLRISRGLIAQRTGTIPVDRVQAIRVVQGWCRRICGYCSLEVEVAGLSTTDDAERMLFPLVKLARAPELVAIALPELGWHPGPLHPVLRRARRRYFTLPLWIALLLSAGLVWLPGWGRDLAVLPLPVALLIGWGQAADAAWAIDQTTVTLRWRRVLSRHTVVARRQRVQRTEVSQSIWQRRGDLASIRLLLSSKRRARLRHLEASEANMLLHIIGRRPPPVM